MPQPLRFMSSADPSPSLEGHQDLLVVTYTQVQKESPEFVTVFDSIDQNIDIRVSTFIFRTAPEPVISLYDFVMTTFMSQASRRPSGHEIQASQDTHEIEQSRNNNADGKMRILVKLASVQGTVIKAS